jgi:hypothetical protein
MNLPGPGSSSTARRTWFHNPGATCHSSSSLGWSPSSAVEGCERASNERDGQWRSLDEAATRDAARFDPTSFVRANTLIVIDEIQRDPDLLLAIKETVDADPRPGRFL